MSGTIGKRYEQLSKVLEDALEHHREQLSDSDIDFAEQMLDRLAQYGESTYVSVAQINWINRIEDKCSGGPGYPTDQRRR